MENLKGRVLLEDAGLQQLEVQMSDEHQHAEYPLSVKDVARFMGVSCQTVYLWVAQKKIPHLRVMGRNIRFLPSEMEVFRATFRVENEAESACRTEEPPSRYAGGERKRIPQPATRRGPGSIAGPEAAANNWKEESNE